jgi:outer membrane receptor protein involved in Fe transport
VRSNSSTIVNAQVGYNFTPRLTLTVDFLNLFDTKTDDIQYFYTYRLQGQPAAGVSGRVIHPAEPFEVRAGLTYRF